MDGAKDNVVDKSSFTFNNIKDVINAKNGFTVVIPLKMKNRYHIYIIKLNVISFINITVNLEKVKSLEFKSSLSLNCTDIFIYYYYINIIKKKLKDEL
jgi:hypothetical protein